ncbi:ABC transporter substrate-binding protein [Kineococcus aurantiacus]|uniref:Raffinose/stachyose/melibiose transport system substrate-binding protein n=1 Tax=Kineococcus aurantiacus TaxID=37633 RepID=A0A7Y9J1K4_9ACTN|nr:extracellular solute-binding protein [Kineococcus aurantiacus]NYD23225.1 raffinose/stachyose/melibiose transport system substrate-binding protein [Kineococcus aurantiacus]
MPGNTRRALVAAGLTAVLGLAACGGGGSGTGAVADVTASPTYSGELSILTKFGQAELAPYFTDLAAAYEQQHPDVDVKLIQETDQSVKDKTKTLVASQALPDIYFTWTGNWADNFTRAGLAADLTPVLGPGTEWGSTFSKPMLDAFAQDGKYYGIPLYTDAKFMGYNEKVFADLGLDVPATFEELLSDCGTIQAAGLEPIAFGNKDGWPGLHYLQQLFAYNVPTATLEADFDPATATWTDPGYVKSMEQFVQLVQRCTSTGAQSNGVLYTTAKQQQSDGHAAMYYQEIIEFDGTAAEGTPLARDGFGFFPLPVPEGAAGDPEAIEGAPEGYFVNARSKNAALAVDFMKFVTSQENGKVLSAPPYGQPSAVVGAAGTSSPAVAASVQELDEASAVIPWLDTITVPDVASAWLAGGEALVNGDRTPQEVLAGVQKASAAAKG